MKKERKSKFYIFLIEILCGILFFALSSIVCVNFFVRSNNLSREAVLKNEAMILAENVAENMRIFDGKTLDGFRQINDLQMQMKQNDYVINVDSIKLDLNYMKHNITVSIDDKVLVDFNVMSGGY
ncbi:hypothetical protein [Anaerorhabdus sp.]|jgi:Tfp pilus assembly protein PilV|uniref:hypothetical protein n=1 Tax=Anaerorhabdus sp. TaxID=1872524 RepID=UPI002FC86B6A